MKKDFDALIASYRDRGVPDLPGSFAQDVLREIRMRADRPDSTTSWWRDVVAVARRPSWMAAGIGIALVAGMLAPSITSPSSATPAGPGLDLGIFSSAAKNLPSGILARIP